MDIEKTGGARLSRAGIKSSAVKKNKKAGSSHFQSRVPVEAAGGDYVHDEVEAPNLVDAPVGVAGLDALLAVQEVTYRDESLKEDISWGKNMLSHLENLRSSLLKGEVAKKDLQAMLGMVESKKRRSTDENLHRILDEIELRARVELAKLGVDHQHIKE